MDDSVDLHWDNKVCIVNRLCVCVCVCVCMYVCCLCHEKYSMDTNYYLPPHIEADIANQDMYTYDKCGLHS